MARPREAGGLAEASKLLQEGLQLLAEREREVDRLLEDARERALLIREAAEQRAAQITADAEAQRTELEGLVATLRSEVEALRAELAELRSGAGAAALGAAVAATAAAAAAASPSPPPVAEATTDAAEPLGGHAEVGSVASEPPTTDATESGATGSDAPRWGRPSTAFGGQQAIRSAKPAKPRWLPPWLPFLLILLVAAAIAGTNVNGLAGTHPTSVDTAVAAQAVGADPQLQAANLSQPTSLLVEVAQAQITPTPTLASTATPVPAPVVSLTATAARPSSTATSQPIALPPAGAQLGSPVAVPGDAGPQGPIVAAYTAYSSYVVRPGDTLNQVATQFGVSGDTIVRSSGLVDPNLLVPGQILTIPRESGWLYRAQPGDSLETIGLKLSISTDELLQANPNLVGASVKPGDLVFVPDHGQTPPKR